MQTTFEKVAQLNTAFGNPKGDLSNPNVPAIRKQAMLCLEEAVEMVEAAYPGMQVTWELKRGKNKAEPGPNDLDLVGLMDAQGDLTTVNDGVAHIAGFDGNAVYQAVHESNMTKFCKTKEEVYEALDWYFRNTGFLPGDIAAYGQYPFVAIKVVQDIKLDGKFYPAGKFLKNMPCFKEPDFSDLLLPKVTE